MLPNFFIVGAAKSGTTALYHYLCQHPEVYMSPIKEPNHFCTDIDPEKFSKEFILHEKLKNFNLKEYISGPMKVKQWGYFVKERKDYEMLFKHVTTQKAIGEVSNSYLFSETAAKNIYSEIPHAKIIIMLRNPVFRAYSHYQANLRDGKTYLSFREEIERDSRIFPKGWGKSYLYLEMGYYYKQVRRFTDLFPSSQVKIYLYDDFKENADRVMKDLFIFIGVSSKTQINFTEKINEAAVPVNSKLLYALSKYGIKKKVFHTIPTIFQKQIKSLFFRSGNNNPISDEDKNYLTGIYSDEIRQLSTLINRDLSEWFV